MTSARFAKFGLAGLLGLAVAGGPAVQAAETQPPVSASKKWESEFSLWQKVSASSDPAGYEDYLKQYPSGTFASMARLRLAELNAAGVAKPAKEAGESPQGTDSAAPSAKEKAQAEQKAAEAARLKAEEEAKVAAEKAKAEEERLAAEAERKRQEDAERLRKEKQARAEANAKRAAEAKAAAERKAAEEAAQAERLKAEQQARAEAERLKAEQEAKAAAEAKAKAEAEQAAAEAERKRIEAAAEAARVKAEQAAEAEARAKAAAAEAETAKAEAARAAAEAERVKAEEAAAAEQQKGGQAAGNAGSVVPVDSQRADSTDTEALPTEPDNSAAAATATKAETDEAERLARREDNSWSRAVLNGRPAAFENYLAEFPNGRFAAEARQRLAALANPANDSATAEGDESANDVIAKKPVATQQLQSRTTVFETSPDVREAYLERGTRAQSQRWLTVLGYDTGGADGVFGPRTRSAIAAWQHSLGHRADGYLTRKQYRQLRESGQFAEQRYRQRVARQQTRRYSNDGYGVYEGPVDGYLEGPVGGYLEGPVGGYYEGPVDGYYEGPVDGYYGRPRRGGLSGPGY